MPGVYLLAPIIRWSRGVPQATPQRVQPVCGRLNLLQEPEADPGQADTGGIYQLSVAGLRDSRGCGLGTASLCHGG